MKDLSKYHRRLPYLSEDAALSPDSNECLNRAVFHSWHCSDYFVWRNAREGKKEKWFSPQDKQTFIGKTYKRDKVFGCLWMMNGINRMSKGTCCRSPISFRSLWHNTGKRGENSKKKCLRELTEIYSSHHTILVALGVVNVAFQSVTERTAPWKNRRIPFDRSLLRVARRVVEDWVVQVLCWSVSTTSSCNRY